ncbi:hypothetical protein [Nostoc sp.]|uniref:hypothetical protein n=1 Tax=Nostoc sp. TaxID=1180 RepID=UPI002FF7BD41
MGHWALGIGHWAKQFLFSELRSEIPHSALSTQNSALMRGIGKVSFSDEIGLL